MEIFTHGEQELKYKSLGHPESDTVFIWAHGWGHSHAAFLKLAGSLEGLGHHVLLDLPGFGESPRPVACWSPEDYAHFLKHFAETYQNKRIIWVGHSFGCRIGIHMAAHYPHVIHTMILLSAAGLKRKRGIFKSVYFALKVYCYKFLKTLIRFGLSESWLKSRFGSNDYKSAGEMRDIFLATIREDLSETSKRVTCRTILMTGRSDNETPPEMGERYQTFIPDSAFIQLDGFDHYSILDAGSHQVATIIKNEILREII